MYVSRIELKHGFGMCYESSLSTVKIKVLFVVISTSHLLLTDTTNHNATIIGKENVEAYYLMLFCLSFF